MKTTIEISDSLAKEAKRLAAARGVTLRSLVEQGLRQVLSEERARPDFVWRDLAVDGKGIRPEVAGASFQEIVRMAYGDRL